MNASKQITTTHTSIPHCESETHVSSAISLLTRCRLRAYLIALTCLATTPTLQAVTPAPDGGYPGYNTAEGDFALDRLSTGQRNTAAGYAALGMNETGWENTAIGAHTLQFNSNSFNTATGTFALYVNSGSNNTATGSSALKNNLTGSSNTASGAEALRLVNGSQNTATGARALYGNSGTSGGTSYNNGSHNTATGFESLFSNKDGGYNVANGWQTLYSNTSGISNSATGAIALHQNTTGSYNTATGTNALRQNVSGSNNTASGMQALYNNNGQNNTASGAFALQNNTSGSSNVALGLQAGSNLTTGSNNIVIGANVLGAAGDANKIRIGKQGTQSATYIAGIYGKSVFSASGVAVFVDTTGKLGTIKSSARYKKQIRPMDKASEPILDLEPVTFRYKQELDPNGVTQFGLIAEQVEKVSPDLVVRDENGKVETVRYEAVNAMLLNEFLKEHTTVQQQKTEIAELKSLTAKQQKQIEALTTAVEKVNDKVKLAQSAYARVAEK
jgi:hypothetical protein